MELLSLRKGSTLNKDQFLNHLYGGIDEPELKIIDVFICKLRKKLEKASGGKNYIETVWGRGYVLRDPDEKFKRFVFIKKAPFAAGLSAFYTDAAHKRRQRSFRHGRYAG